MISLERNAGGVSLTGMSGTCEEVACRLPIFARPCFIIPPIECSHAASLDIADRYVSRPAPGG